MSYLQYLETMRLLILFLCVIFYSCDRSDKKHSINPAAKKLHDSAVSIVIKVRDYPRAIDLLNQAIQVDSNYFAAYNSKFSFLGLSKSGDLNELLKTLENLIRLRPDLPDFYFYSGVISLKANDSIASKKYFNDAIRSYDKILDTVKADKALREIFSINKGISLILVEQEVAGHDLLKQVYEAESDTSFKSKIAKLMTMSKQSLVDTLSFSQ